MTIDDVIRWSDIHIKLIEDDLPTIKDNELFNAQMRAYKVQKMMLKSLLCWKEHLEETEKAEDYNEVAVIRKYIAMIEAEGEGV